MAQPLQPFTIETSEVTNNYAINSTNNTYDSLNETDVFWSLEWRVILAIVLCVIIVFAVVGNVMVVMVILRHRGMRTRTNLFLCNLACSDLLCAFVNMPLSLVTVIHGRWIFGATLCQINGFLTPFTFVTSIHTLMYISIHKYLSIKKPFSHILTHFRIMLMVLCAWIWGALTSYLTIHGLNSVSYKPYTTQCGPSYPYDIRTYFHEGFTYITCYLIPLIIMMFCYIVMCYEIKAHALRMVLSTTTDKDVIFMQQRRITFTLFLVLITFMCCWTPHVIYAAYSTIVRDKADVPHLANPFVYWLGYLSCACNPVIYALRSPAFREGYRQLLCTCKTPKRNNERRQDEHKPLGRFRAFLRENLRGTLHASGSLTGTPMHSPPTSRKSSMSSLTNYLLFPKTRTLSTNSLPGNFRFSVGMPPLIVDKDTTQVSFIAGIPVLTKGGKIVTYTNPHEVALKRRTNPVYYPRLSQLERALLCDDNKRTLQSGSKGATEKSPLIPRFVPSNLSVRQRQAHQSVPTKHRSTLTPHIEVPEIFIEADINGELAEFGPELPRFTARPSCESGFNDVDHYSEDDNDSEDQVFLVVADIEQQPRHVQNAPEEEHLLTESVCGEEPAMFLGSVGLDSLRVPGAGGLTRHRVCKSVSDACDRNRPVMVGQLVTKSTSDTCLKETIDTADSRVDRHKKSSEKSIRRKFMNRFFSRIKKGSSPRSDSQGSRLDLQELDIADDISDSGMVSGMHDSPSLMRSRDHKDISRDHAMLRNITSHSFSAADTRKASTLDNRGKKSDNQGHRALSISRSSSDPSMAVSKSRSHSKRQHDKRAARTRLKSRRSHEKGKRRSREMDLNLTHKGLSRGAELQRSKSMKTGKYPSVEKLDRDPLDCDASTVKHKVKHAHGSGPHSARDSSIETRAKHRTSKQTDIQPIKIFHLSESHFMHTLHRSVSDPGLTFKKIEEKVLQRSATKKWHKTRYARRDDGKDSLNVTDNSDQDYHWVAMDSSILTSSSTSKSPDGDHSNQLSGVALDSSVTHSDSTNQASCSDISDAVLDSKPSHHARSSSGKYLSLQLPFNESSPICLSNLSLNKVASSDTLPSHVSKQGHVTSSHVIAKEHPIEGAVCTVVDIPVVIKNKFDSDNNSIENTDLSFLRHLENGHDSNTVTGDVTDHTTSDDVTSHVCPPLATCSDFSGDEDTDLINSPDVVLEIDFPSTLDSKEHDENG